MEVSGQVFAVSRAPTHSFSKCVEPSIRLVAGLGVQWDAHCGMTVKHRSRVAQDPSQPNLRQVHLIHAELFDELAAKGFRVSAGQMGENITTIGLDLLSLPVGTKLRIGDDVVLALTGLRNPCVQLDEFQPGLMNAVLERSPDGGLIRKAGVMSIVLVGGMVYTRDKIRVEYPPEPFQALERV